jgi:TRAP transporter TAXI family solute receptor
LNAVGLDPDRDLRRQGLSVNASVDALKDGKIDAFFWAGGIPTASLLDLTSTMGIRAKLLPNDDLLPALQAIYGPSLYFRLVIPGGTYPGRSSDVGVVAVANILVVDERMNDDLAYDLTRVLFDKQKEIAAVHPEGARLTLETAIAGSPAPFHPGAIRYYRERAVWKQ